MRKLKRKRKSSDIDDLSKKIDKKDVLIEGSSVKRTRLRKLKAKKVKKARKTIKKYKKQRCAYIRGDGTQCKYLAVGKSTLCKTHGGNPVVKENLIVASTTEKALIDPNSKFDPAIHPISYIDFSREGLSDVEIAAQFEVSVETINNWAEKYKTFNTAWEIGQAMHEAWWLRQGKNNLTNKRNFNSSLFKFMTMNKLGYSDKIEQKNMNMNVHGVLMIPDAVSEEEWENEDVIDVDS